VIELEAEQARVVVRWIEAETVTIEHDAGVELSVEPAGDRLSIGAVGPAGSGPSRLQVSEQGIVVRLGGRGGISIGPHGIELEGLGLRRRRAPEVPRAQSLQLAVPLSLPELVVVVRHGTLHLEEPRGRIEASVDDGELTVAGGEGRLTAGTGIGDVLVDGYAGNIELTAGSGEITLRGVEGSIGLRAGSGDVVVRGGRGPLAASVGSGTVQVVACRCPSLSVKAGSGEVRVVDSAVDETTVNTGSGRVSSQAWLGTGRHEFATGNGDISVALPRGLPARIEVTTRGDVESSVPLVVVGQRGPRSPFGRRLVGSVGEGSGPRAEIIVRSNQGDVSLDWLERPEPVAARTPSPPSSPEASPQPAAGHRQAATSAEDDARAVLEALAEGQITIEEAQLLLDRLLR
jgi:hypothetical protein